MPGYHLVRLAGEDPKLQLADTFEGHHHEKLMEEVQDMAVAEVHPGVLVVAEHRLGALKPAVNIVTEAI